MEADAGPTVTVATGAGVGAGAVTVIPALPVTPPAVARRVVVPAATADATPADDIVATAGLVELQVIGRPRSTFPLASRTVAANVAFCPTTNDAVTGLSVTEAITACAVVAVAVLDTAPKVAFWPSVPRKARIRNRYAVDAASPRISHVRTFPTPDPTTGALHVPRATGVEELQLTMAVEYRTS
jgi:hypothetical protein